MQSRASLLRTLAVLGIGTMLTSTPPSAPAAALPNLHALQPDDPCLPRFSAQQRQVLNQFMHAMLQLDAAVFMPADELAPLRTANWRQSLEPLWEDNHISWQAMGSLAQVEITTGVDKAKLYAEAFAPHLARDYADLLISKQEDALILARDQAENANRVLAIFTRHYPGGLPQLLRSPDTKLVTPVAQFLQDQKLVATMLEQHRINAAPTHCPPRFR